jgi:hypothetical protein
MAESFSKGGASPASTGFGRTHRFAPTGIIEFVEAELSAGRSDVIHDILAFLAEQMIEMNKIKNEEIKGFLKWLEREIGGTIEDLNGKTVIKDYHELNDIEAILDVLKKNLHKLNKVDPSDREFQELLEKQFHRSISILAPLKKKITATDNLIDQIVYKLYDLTQDEIKIVEDS